MTSLMKMRMGRRNEWIEWDGVSSVGSGEECAVLMGRVLSKECGRDTCICVLGVVARARCRCPVAVRNREHAREPVGTCSECTV